MTKSGNEKSTDRAYRVLARKYRPQNFDDLIGHEPMVQTLSNAFKTGRIAQAYMLTGVRGIGKTTTARILARALNYKSDDIDTPTVDLSTPGENCQAIMEGNHLDIIEMDAASHTGIDDIRDLIESAQYRPVSARYKVYIIDEVHMLSRSAFNGLLKTLEEPPEHLKFIFATTEIRKVPVTVLSRCQRFDLRRVNSETMANHLLTIAQREDVEIDDASVGMIVRASEGSVRDALSLLDQAIAHGGNKSGARVKIESESLRSMLGLADRARIIDLFEHLMKGNMAECLEEMRAQYDLGAEPSVVLSDLADFVHFVTRLKYVPEAASDPAISEFESKKAIEFSEGLSVRVLGRAWQILLKGIEEVGTSERPLMAADMVLVRLAHAADLPTPDELIRQAVQGDGTNNNGANKVADHSGGEPGAHQPGAAGSSRVSNNNVAGNPDGGIAAGVERSKNIAMAAGEQGVAGASLRLASSALPMVVVADSAPNNEPEKDIAGQNELVTLDQFEELIFLAEDKRDLQIKTWLRRHVRLVSFEDCRMEFSIAGTPPVSFIPDLQEKLKSWTGKRWNLIISSRDGTPSIEETELAEEAKNIDQAHSDPDVEAILARFPGAKVVDVRIKSAESNAEDHDGGGSGHHERELDNDGLDDFFE